MLSIGIESLSNTESVPTLKTTTLTGFVKEEFALPSQCLTFGLGWKNCDTSITLDMPRYPEGSYKIMLSGESRPGISVDVPLEVVDQTPDQVIIDPNNGGGDSTNPGDTDSGDTGTNPNPGTTTPQTPQKTIDTVVNFLSGKTTEQTSTGVKITRSSQPLDFGSDDIQVILILIGITASVAILAKYRKKLK